MVGQAHQWVADYGNSTVVDQVAIGEDGAGIFVVTGTANIQADLYGDVTNTPTWTDTDWEPDSYDPCLAAASNQSNVYAWLGCETNGVNPRDVFVTVWQNTGGTPSTPLWSADIGLNWLGGYGPWLFVADDGTEMAACGIEATTGVFTIYKWNDPLVNSATTVTASVWPPFKVVADSTCTHIAALSASLARLVRLDTGATITTFYAGGPSDPIVDANFNGTHLAVATTTALRFGTVTAGTWTGIGTWNAPTNWRISAVAPDGSGTYCGVMLRAGNTGTSRAMLIDVVTGTVVLDYTWRQTTYQNAAPFIKVSTTGDKMVLGLWGDAEGRAPEVMMFRFGDAFPMLAHTTGGSVLAGDATPDLSHFVVGVKEAHATTFGSGEKAYLWKPTLGTP